MIFNKGRKGRKGKKRDGYRKENKSKKYKS